MALTTYRMNYCLECTAGFGVYVDNVHNKDGSVRSQFNPANVLWYGAVGDGVTDDITAIQDAIDAMFAAGGGDVYVPPGTYNCSTPIYLYEGVRLFGDGPESHIVNTAVSGFDKNVIVCGTAGSWGNATENLYSSYGAGNNLTYYDIETLARGTSLVTFNTAGESANFTAGDIVLLESYDTFSSGEPLYVMVNIVESVGVGTLVLKYPALDNYTTTGGNHCKIATMTGNALEGGDGVVPATIVKNVHVQGLRLSNVIGGASQWFGLYLACVESTFRDLVLDNIAKGIGTVATGYCTLDNITINYDTSGIDHSYFHTCCIFRNLRVTRIDTAASLGADNIVMLHEPGGGDVFDGAYINGKTQGNYGISLFQAHHSRVSNCVVANAELSGVYIGVPNESEDNTLQNTLVIGMGQHGIFCGGKDTKIIGNQVGGIAATYYGIRIAASAESVICVGNSLGLVGERTKQDIIYDIDYTTNEFTRVQAWGNKTFTTHHRRSLFVTVDTGGSTGNVTLLTETINQDTLRTHQEIRIFAAGRVTGTNDAKTIDIKWGAQSLGQIAFAAGETGDWELDSRGVLGNTNIDTWNTGWQGTTVEVKDFLTFAHGLAAGNVDITVVGNCANAGDTVYLDSLVIEFPNDQVSGN